MRAENNLEIQEQVVFQAIQHLVQEYNALQVEYEQSNQKMEAQNLAFTIAQKRYEKGLINALELFTAKISLPVPRTKTYRYAYGRNQQKYTGFLPRLTRFYY